VVRAARCARSNRYETAKPHLFYALDRVPEPSADSDREAGTDIVIRLSLLLVQLSLISARLRFKAMVDQDEVTPRKADGERGLGSDVKDRKNTKQQPPTSRPLA
jgi:hypothetical protein